MRLLLVFPFVPYPPDDGGRIGFFNPIKYLSRFHDVMVVTLMSDDETGALEELEKLFPNVRAFRRSSRRDWPNLLLGAVSDPPGAARKYWRAEAGQFIQQAIAWHRPDVVEFHHLNTAAYRNFARPLPIILREHNVEYKIWERYSAQASGWPERLYARWTAPRVRAYEAGVAAEFDRCIVVSAADREYLKGASPSARIEVVPSGVDTEYFRPAPEVEQEPWSITLTGSFKWEPKQQSLYSLLTQIFPRIKAKVPQAKLYIVGKGVPEHLRRLAEKISGVIICGLVPDVRPYIARSALLIQYLESGGGIALKVLEALAMRKPVLSNTLGCEGIPLTHGRDVFLADDVEEFAAAAATLLNDSALRKRLAEEGYRRVYEHYSWHVIASRLQDCYQGLIHERRNANKVQEATRALCDMNE